MADVKKVINILLTPEQLNNLKIFLLRTDLKGGEIEQFMEIANILNNPEGEEKDGEKTNDNNGS